MKAWERARLLMNKAVPKILSDEEQTWNEANTLEDSADALMKMLWASHVPGSYAPESIMVAAVQSMENRGYTVKDGDGLIEEGLDALSRDDSVTLNKISAQLWYAVNNAEKNPHSVYWTYSPYHDFDSYIRVVSLPPKTAVQKDTVLLDRLTAGWIAQIIGGAVGTAIEGYTTQAIRLAFGQIDGYVRKPNTYNDDITFELALLKAVEEKGRRQVSSLDIALNWIGYIPMAWSAEDIALRNIRYGIFPPQSGRTNNPFSDWIGAQMRGAICGMLFPGDAYEAASLAWKDAVISHDNNGILGEVFNAVLTALSFVHQDVRVLLDGGIRALPSDSEYAHFANMALHFAKTHENWNDAWTQCEAYFVEYNWIHAYPNLMAEIIALYYGNGDFMKTLTIISMAGQDVDCNAAQILSILGIINGTRGLPKSLKEPIGDRLDTYLRKDRILSIQALAKRTYACIEEEYQ